MNYFGRFKIKVEREDGSVEDTGFINNLFLNNYFALQNYSTYSLRSVYCLFGTGSTPPALTDVALENQVENGHILIKSNDYMRQVPFEQGFEPDNQYKWFMKYTMTFEGTKGLFEGNISEIGLSYGHSNDYNFLFTRALIKDAQGNPTTISVGPNDIVTVVYEVGYKMDFSNNGVLGTKVVNINGVDTTVTLHAVGYNKDWTSNNYSSWRPIKNTNSGGDQFSFIKSASVGYMNVVSGGINRETGELLPGATQIASLSYRSGQRKADGTYIKFVFNKFNIPPGVATGTWDTMYFSGADTPLEPPYYSSFNYCVAMTFDPPIQKGEADEFTFNNLEIKCGRK